MGDVFGVCWGVDRSHGHGAGSTDVFIFGFCYGCYMGASGGSFYDSRVGKPMGPLLDESLE